MLTKDLLRTRSAGVYIRPQFIRTDDPELLRVASSLIALYERSAGEKRELLESLAETETAPLKDQKLGRGLLKILNDRATFSCADAFDYAAARAELFEASARLLREESLPEAADTVRAAVFSALPAEAAFRVRDVMIYEDLPEFETLCSVRKIFAKELLERYNLALVQTLILFSNALDLQIPKSEPPEGLRRLFKYLRFFRLLVLAEEESSAIHLRIDGPAGILENSSKYGFQLASFFPAVCQLKQWHLTCDLKPGTLTKRLVLDESSALVSHFSNFSAYQPEEYKLFAGYFSEQKPAWILSETPDFLRFSSAPQKIVFPDFEFRSADNPALTRKLELFHRWHATQLQERLAMCHAETDCNLLLGVDRALLKKDDRLKKQLEQDPYFSQYGFFFRDFPGVENVTKLLEKSVRRELF